MPSDSSGTTADVAIARLRRRAEFIHIMICCRDQAARLPAEV